MVMHRPSISVKSQFKYIQDKAQEYRSTERKYFKNFRVLFENALS